MDREERKKALAEAVARWARERGVPEDQVRKELGELHEFFGIARMDGEDFDWSDYRDEEDPLWWVSALADWAEMFGYTEVYQECEPYL